jgi:hypothetical protein
LTEQNLKLQTKSFSVNNFLSSDKDISYYTGFPNVKIFMSVFELVENPTQYYEYLKKCLNENLGRKRLHHSGRIFYVLVSASTQHSRESFSRFILCERWKSKCNFENLVYIDQLCIHEAFL